MDGGPLGDRRWMEYTTGIEDHTAIESQLKLIQNYPNPFSTSTTVRFMLREGSDVNITLYNLVGAKVRVIGDQFYSQGLNEIKLDRGNLGAGVYFLQVSSQEATDLIKITVK
jgi:pectate lyase